jgi:peptide/nickel transport system substrate-binding protein
MRAHKVVTSHCGRSVVVATAVLVVLLLVVGCGNGGSKSSQSTSRTLNMAFSYDQGSLDPDVFYGNEGLAITNACYEGLLRYKSSSSEKEPWLAQSWEESPDGLVYTFHLRSGVKFQDGTSFDSSAMKFDFERRIKLNTGPSYMLAGIASMRTPDPLTFVVTLKKPVQAFLDHLASPYGPVAISPTAIRQHERKGDLGQAWLAAHSAGTGPYYLASVAPGASYVLKSFTGYWGPKAYYTNVNFLIMPSFTTQQLELQAGKLDIMLHGIDTQDLKKYGPGSGFQIHEFPTSLMDVADVCPNGTFRTAADRVALAEAIDRSAIVAQVYGKRATVGNTMFTPGAMPAGLGLYNPPYDPSKLKALVATLPTKKVDLAYNWASTEEHQEAEIMQTELSALGLDVTIRSATHNMANGYITNPRGRPDIMLGPLTPDDFSVGSFPQLYYMKGAPLNYLGADNNPEADAVLTKALSTADMTTANQLFNRAAALYAASGDFIPFAAVNETVVARDGITGWQVGSAAQWSMRIQYLRAG